MSQGSLSFLLLFSRSSGGSYVFKGKHRRSRRPLHYGILTSIQSASRKLLGPGAVFSLKPTLHGRSSDSSPSLPRIQRPAMNFGPVATLLAFLLLSCVITPCRAQTSKIFQWSFSGNVRVLVVPADPVLTDAYRHSRLRYLHAGLLASPSSLSLLGTIPTVFLRFTWSHSLSTALPARP